MKKDRKFFSSVHSNTCAPPAPHLPSHTAAAESSARAGRDGAGLEGADDGEDAEVALAQHLPHHRGGRQPARPAVALPRRVAVRRVAALVGPAAKEGRREAEAGSGAQPDRRAARRRDAGPARQAAPRVGGEREGAVRECGT